MAFIEELQRRLAPQDEALRFKHAHTGLGLSKSSPDLARADLDADLDGVLPEHRAPFELRALEVALDVVRTFSTGMSTLQRTHIPAHVHCTSCQLGPMQRAMMESSLLQGRRLRQRPRPASLVCTRELWGLHTWQVATTLERQAIDLEASAHPALDELTAKVYIWTTWLVNE